MNGAFTFVRQPSSIIGAQGSLRTITCSAVPALSSSDTTYAWHISGSFSNIPDLSATGDLNLVTLSGIVIPPGGPEYFTLSGLAQVVSDTFQADTNTLRVRLVDNTCFGPLSGFTFFCVASGSEGESMSNPVTVSLNSYPTYPDISPYYALLNEGKSYEAFSGIVGTVFLPGSIVFSSSVPTINILDDLLTVTLNPNLLAEPYNYVAFEAPALGYELLGNGNVDTNGPRFQHLGEYFSPLVDNESSGTISFTQGSKIATYHFLPNTFFAQPTIIGGQTIADINGNGGHLELIQASSGNFNNRDPITVSITVEQATADFLETNQWNDPFNPWPEWDSISLSATDIYGNNGVIVFTLEAFDPNNYIHTWNGWGTHVEYIGTDHNDDEYRLVFEVQFSNPSNSYWSLIKGSYADNTYEYYSHSTDRSTPSKEAGVIGSWEYDVGTDVASLFIQHGNHFTAWNNRRMRLLGY